MASQEELILKQFAAARQNLGSQKKQAEDQMQAQMNRQQAMGGLTGGAAVKAQQKGLRSLSEGFGTAEAQLSGSEAESLRQTQAQKEAQEFGSSEAEKQRAFQSTEAGKERSQQAEQFGRTFSLQQAQFNEAKNQFSQQMGYQMKEFNENQKTNLVNALAAIDRSRIPDQTFLNQLFQSWSRINSTIGPVEKTPSSIPYGGGDTGTTTNWTL